MATKSTVKNLGEKVKRLHGLKEMKSFAYWELRTVEALQEFYTSEDNFNNALDEYYGAAIMHYLIEKPALYDVYINLHKEEAKKRFLRQLVKTKETKRTNQLIIKKLSDLKQEQKQIKTNPKKQKRLKFITLTIARLEAWAKDLNYEERKGETIYKE